MSTLRTDVADYLATRRTMGFKVEGLGKLLSSFVTFCEAHGATQVQIDLAVQWATTMIKVPVTDALIARRMDAVRVFARHHHALDPATQIPPEGIGNRRYQPREPNVFTEAQVLSLLTATDTLTPPFRAQTWRTLIGLLAATGMRPGEACHLSVEDIGPEGRRPAGPGDEVRQVQTRVHPPDHGHGPGRLPAGPKGRGRDHGTSLPGRVRQQPPRSTRPGPAGRHLHPGRRRCRHHYHAGAPAAEVARSETHLHRDHAPRLVRDGHDVQARLPLLSTWLGHVDPASTYWYLHAVPELLAHAADRLEPQAGTSIIEPNTELVP